MKKYLLTGLAILLPLTVSIAIIIFLLHFLTNPFIGLVSNIFAHTKMNQINFYFLTTDQVIKIISEIIILLSFFIFTILIGYLTNLFFIKYLLHLSDRLLHKIPLINKIYKTVKEIINSLFVEKKSSFKQVVLAPFTDDLYVIGLITKDTPNSLTESQNDDRVSVFIPTALNPTTGFLFMYKREQLAFLDIKTEDAFKYVISCGLVIPREIQAKGDFQ
jgi:uncharacterized membrane protein